MSQTFDARKIMSEVAEKHGLTVDAMLAKKNGKSTRMGANARAEAAYRLRVELWLSPSLIGWFLKLHHTSVMAAVGKVHKHVKAGKVWPIGYDTKKPKSIAMPEQFPRIEKRIAREFLKATQLVARINAAREEQGIEAKAFVVREGDEFHVRSPIEAARSIAA